MKNILVIGNGFDLAHGLNTSYERFISFCEAVRYMNHLDELSDMLMARKFEKSVLLQAKKFLGSKSVKADEFIELCKENYWLRYVIEHKDTIGKRWCDLEYNIYIVINSLAYIMDHVDILEKPYNFKNVNHFDEILSLVYLIDTVNDLEEDDIWRRFEVLKEYLLKNLNDLTWMLEIYLTKFLNRKSKRIEFFEKLSVSYVLSFNYTDTYRKMYGRDHSNIIYHYIHGQSINNRTKNENNMVFGIGDFVDHANSTNEYNFLDFQKYYQRIIKKTGVLYKDWLKNIDNEHLNIIMYGHSLDVVDGDVIKDLVSCDKAKLMIVYYDQNALKSIVSNLIKILGKDLLISLTSTYKIEFFQTNEVEKINKQLHVIHHSETLIV